MTVLDESKGITEGITIHPGGGTNVWISKFHGKLLWNLFQNHKCELHGNSRGEIRNAQFILWRPMSVQIAVHPIVISVWTKDPEWYPFSNSPMAKTENRFKQKNVRLTVALRSSKLDIEQPWWNILAFIVKYSQYSTAPHCTCFSYFQADSEFVLTFFSYRSAPGCSHSCESQRSSYAMMIQSRSGWGHHLSHQLQLAVCIDGNVTSQYFPNRHSWLHSEIAGDQSAE